MRKPWKAIILDLKECEAKLELTIDNNGIESTKSVKILGITIDERLQFDQWCIKFVFQSHNVIKHFRSTPKNIEKPENNYNHK